MAEITPLLDLLRSRSPEEWARVVREIHLGGADAGEGPRDVYTRARAHFAGREEQLRQDDAVSERLLDGMRRERQRPEPSPPQLSVVLVASGGVASGRFVLDNPSAVARSLSFRPSELRGSGWEAWVPVRIAPARLELAPGTKGTIAIELVLPERDLAGAHAELDIEVQSQGRVVAIVWVRLELG